MVKQLIKAPLMGLILIGLLSGCGIKTDGLIPPDMTPPDKTIQKSVTIMPVLGGRGSTFGREAYITNEQYHEALIKTLEKSGIFAAINNTGDADLQLHSEIVTITTEAGLSPEYAIVVQYWITETASSEEIWRKGINTRHQVKFGEHLAGATRIIKAVEGATQKNLIKLVEALASSNL